MIGLKENSQKTDRKGTGIMKENRYELNKQLAQMLKGGVIMDVTTPEQAKKMSESADGVIVGSAIVKIIAKYGKDSVKPVCDYVKSMKEAIS